MCLIMFSRSGALPDKDLFWQAAIDNPDGIGIMSALGVEKFLGKKHVRKAWRYIVKNLEGESIPFGVHFRWATHGEVTRRNCHPFKVPELGAYLMHNGILFTHAEATTEDSDTAIFARKYLPQLGEPGSHAWRSKAKDLAGYGNKLLVMHGTGPATQFSIVNESAGAWISTDLWLSNRNSCRTDFTWRDEYPTLSGRSTWTGRGYGATWDDDADWLDRSYREPYNARDLRASYTLSADERALAEDFARYMTDDEEMEAREQFGFELSRWDLACEMALAGVQEARLKHNQPAPVKSGFDWHDASTWTKYPIPGSIEDREWRKTAAKSLVIGKAYRSKKA